MQSIFKNASGAYLTKQLFYEFSVTERDRVLYTLKDEDHHGFPSLKRLYLEEGDESEYQVASKYFGGWSHWKRLLQCSWFLDYLSEWREELAAKQSAESLARIKQAAEKGNVSLDKWLLDRGLSDQKMPVGRPTKERIKQEAQKIVLDQRDVQDDLSRLLEGATFNA